MTTRYSPEEAMREAEEMRKKIAAGEASEYGEAAAELAAERHDARLAHIARHPLVQDLLEELSRHLRLVPDDHALRYVKRIESALAMSAKNEAAAASQIDGALFELSRMSTVLRQGLETVDFGASVPANVEYEGYEAKETDFSEQNLRPKRSVISLDIPVVRKGPDGSGKPEGEPYVYEVKSYPRMVYGASAADRNQILKYQRAVERGLVAGATVEIKGRIDPEFLKWLIGESITDPGAAPNVEVVYVMDLPSGAEYRFVVNGTEGRRGLRFQNEHGTYTREDQEVVNGVFKSVVDHSVIGIIASGEVHEPSEALAPLVDDPYGKIKSRDLYREYAAGRTRAMHEAFRRKSAREAVNTRNERSSAEIVAHPEEERRLAVERVFDAFQESLLHDPELMPMRERYAVSDPELRREMIDEALAMIVKVGAFERDRMAVEGDATERPGYRGKPEGVALAADSIVFDAVHIVMRRKEGEPTRSYDAPERFDAVTLDDVMDYLSTQERVYRTCEIFDPATGQTESLVSDGSDEAERRIEKLKAKIPGENDKRLEEAYRKAVAAHERRLGELEAKEDATPAERQELRALKGRSNTDLRQHRNLEETIERRREALKSLSAEKQKLEKEMRKAPPEAKEKLAERLRVTTELLRSRSEESRKLNAADKETIADLRRRFIGDEAWSKLEVRTLSDKTRNLIKFIYIVDAAGVVRLCEEKLKGNAKVRATHSEVAQGRNVYGAGEIVFEKIDGVWAAVELNNGSGHYKPSRLTLPYVEHVVGQKIDLGACATRDTLLRGVTTSEFSELLGS